MRNWRQACVTNSSGVSRRPCPDAPRIALVSAFVTSVLLCVLVGAQSPAPRFDLIVRGGTVIDGTGLPRYRADVAIVNGLEAGAWGVSAGLD